MATHMSVPRSRRERRGGLRTGDARNMTVGAIGRGRRYGGVTNVARSADGFFSSGRGHRSFDCDWSSDVCSSDLVALQVLMMFGGGPATTGGDGPLTVRHIPAGKYEVTVTKGSTKISKSLSVEEGALAELALTDRKSVV